ncbi:hypothetical protein OH76DRAFT_927538 [Lentinus brumalis]|uniref:Uncharacterized protein n=1 Tax=Lentinus brumalis TaxID=2498619 RepID=A0A371D004_9APHY|nr:hypothetical protein OH76DRAFT_927538 [Polyporus brumalis]
MQPASRCGGDAFCWVCRRVSSSTPAVVLTVRARRRDGCSSDACRPAPISGSRRRWMPSGTRATRSRFQEGCRPGAAGGLRCAREANAARPLHSGRSYAASPSELGLDSSPRPDGMVAGLAGGCSSSGASRMPSVVKVRTASCAVPCTYVDTRAMHCFLKDS